MSQRKTQLLRLCAALAAGLAVFFAIESAIARRIGLDLFLPMAEGAFLPGRLARLAASLVAGFALYLTERGRALNERLRGALQKDRWCWLAALVLTGLFFLWTCRVTVITFMSNDDTAIMQTIGNIPTKGLASAAHTFSNILFCAFLGFFYQLDPGGYWYAWYHLAAIFVSLTIIGRCILLKAGKRRWPFSAGALIHLALCCGLFLLTIADLAFTVTPAVAGSAAIALILCRSDTDGLAGHICMDVASILLMLLCYLQRSATGTCLFCFWALAVGYQLIKLLLDRRPGRWKQLIALLLCAVLTVGLLYAADHTGAADLDETVEPDPAYSEAEYYRATVMDYLLGRLTPEDFEAAGIPRELVPLIRSWFFMDERINTETFKKLVDMYYTDDGEPEQAPTLWQTLMNSEGAGNLRRMRWTCEAAVLLLLLAVLSLFRFGRRYWPELLCALCALGGGVILCVYLLRQGRFPLRAFLVVAIPALVTLLLMAVAAPAGDAAPGKRRPVLTGLSALFCAGLAVLCALSTRSMPYITSPATREDVFVEQMATENYANAHPDISFITNLTTNNLDPFHDARTYSPNKWLWGGVGATASSNRQYADAFFRDDTRLMYDQASTLVAVLQYMTLDYGPVQAKVDSHLCTDIYVADLDQITPGEDYTGWYEQNGMTYYFRDGQALTGEQVIDGETYTFTAPGEQSRFTMKPGPDGALYLTTAYSLVDPAA